MDFGQIIAIIIGAVYIFLKFFPRKRQEEERPHIPPQSTQPPVYKKEKSFLETLMDEVEKQKETAKRQQPEIRPPHAQEIKQKVQYPERKLKAKKAQQYSSIELGGVEELGNIDSVSREEGISSISEQYKHLVFLEEQEEEKKFEFNPREAFMMKTLLERPPHF